MDGRTDGRTEPIALPSSLMHNARKLQEAVLPRSSAGTTVAGRAICIGLYCYQQRAVQDAYDGDVYNANDVDIKARSHLRLGRSLDGSADIS